jgi:hypothetical protein
MRKIEVFIRHLKELVIPGFKRNSSLPDGKPE